MIALTWTLDSLGREVATHTVTIGGVTRRYDAPVTRVSRAPFTAAFGVEVTTTGGRYPCRGHVEGDDAVDAETARWRCASAIAADVHRAEIRAEESRAWAAKRAAGERRTGS